MSETLDGSRRRIATVAELGSVVRTMKALAASNVVQFDKAARSSAEYAQIVASGLSVCLGYESVAFKTNRPPGVVVFGSDQGLVGAFNETLAAFVRSVDGIGAARVWAVGERIVDGLAEAGIVVESVFSAPNSVLAITALIGRVVSTLEVELVSGRIGSVVLIHNCPNNSAYECVKRRILPFDNEWKRNILAQPWDGNSIPEAIDPDGITLKSLLRECLFVSLFRSCAESLASENRSRLMAMDLAQKNIADLQEELMRSYHRMRQDSIDEELFDVVFGFEALAKTNRRS